MVPLKVMSALTVSTTHMVMLLVTVYYLVFTATFRRNKNMTLFYMNNEEKIRELYLNPEFGLSSANKLYQKLKKCWYYSETNKRVSFKARIRTNI